jgi:hypothetical protein
VIEVLLAADELHPMMSFERPLCSTAGLALLALDLRRRVEAEPFVDPRRQVLVVVALQTLVVRQLAAVVDMAVVAVVLVVERAVALRQRTG